MQRRHSIELSGYLFIFEVLKRFWFGDYFFKWIKILYTDPTAEVATNNLILCNVQRVTGCGVRRREPRIWEKHALMSNQKMYK
jgi:hypothetical protein